MKKNEKKAELIYLKKAHEAITETFPKETFSPTKVLEILQTVLACLKETDAYTHGHSIRVAEYCTSLALSIGLNEEQIEEVQVASLLHDIGKIGIPDNVLLKPGPLTKPEFEIMKSHSMRGARILEKANAFQSLIEAVFYHHERIDGLGYPNGLKGEDIPLYARMVLIADTFDAMTSTRPYRLALDRKKAFEELTRYKGKQFDTKLVEAFIRGMENGAIRWDMKNRIIRKIA